MNAIKNLVIIDVDGTIFPFESPNLLRARRIFLKTLSRKRQISQHFDSGLRRTSCQCGPDAPTHGPLKKLDLWSSFGPNSFTISLPSQVHKILNQLDGEIAIAIATASHQNAAESVITPPNYSRSNYSSCEHKSLKGCQKVAAINTSCDHIVYIGNSADDLTVEPYVDELYLIASHRTYRKLRRQLSPAAKVNRLPRHRLRPKICHSLRFLLSR